MSIARVVPVRRLPNERSWFDYQIPDGMTIEPGQLITIPFGRQKINGVVWGILSSSKHGQLKEIAAIGQVEPVMTQWQRYALTELAQWYFVSVATLVDSALPTFLKRPEKDSTDVQPVTVHRSARSSRSDRVWWYRDRRGVVNEELDWLLKDQVMRAICVPTMEDLEDYQRALGAHGSGVVFLHSQLTPKEYRQLYEGVRRGLIRKVIGTGRIFFLPWPEEPRLLLDQEDHPAHRQLEQHPRFDNRQTMALVRPQAMLTTPAPSIATMIHHHPTPPSFQGQRRLAALGQPGSHDWLTPDAEEFLTSSVNRGQQVLAIVPHHGFAQRLACRECGWTLVCPTCSQRVRISYQHGATATCGSCGARVDIPLQCPRCQSSRWVLSGLGVEQFVATLRRRWPKMQTRTSDDPVDAVPGVIVGTYQAHRRRRLPSQLGPVLVVSGDALLSYPDFAVSERAWSYLARLQADRSDQPVLVQTYEPDLPFWQRWRHGDDRSWYEDEITQRRTLRLPPAADHWIIYGPGLAPAVLVKKRDELRAMLPSEVTVSILDAHDHRGGEKRGSTVAPIRGWAIAPSTVELVGTFSDTMAD